MPPLSVVRSGWPSPLSPTLIAKGVSAPTPFAYQHFLNQNINQKKSPVHRNSTDNNLDDTTFNNPTASILIRLWTRRLAANFSLTSSLGSVRKNGSYAVFNDRAARFKEAYAFEEAYSLSLTNRQAWTPSNDVTGLEMTRKPRASIENVEEFLAGVILGPAFQ